MINDQMDPMLITLILTDGFFHGLIIPRDKPLCSG
jgi:hypothetical protein